MAKLKTYTDRVQAVACPKCGMLKGSPCQRLRGGERASFHIDRVELAGEADWQRRAAEQEQLRKLVAKLVSARRKAQPRK